VGTGTFDAGHELVFHPIGVNSATQNVAAASALVMDLNPAAFAGYNLIRVDWASVLLEFDPTDLDAEAQLCFVYPLVPATIPFLSASAHIETAGVTLTWLPGVSTQLLLPFYNQSNIQVNLRGNSGGAHASTITGHVAISGAGVPWL
jgi:hypothetical protein